MTENCDHDVAFGRFRDLRLEGGMRSVELGLPADGLEAYGPGKFAVQPLDDAVDATTLMDGVARRGNKDANMPYSIPLAVDGRGLGSRTQIRALWHREGAQPG